MRTEKEEELLALENYWKERLAAQEAETVHRQKLTEQEVSSIISVHKHTGEWWHRLGAIAFNIEIDQP